MSDSEDLAELAKQVRDDFEYDRPEVTQYDEIPTTSSMPPQVWLSQPSRLPGGDEPSPTDITPVDNFRDDGEPAVQGNKPGKGGMWTSTYTPDEKYLSDWLRWCIPADFCPEGTGVHLLYPEDDLNLIELHSHDDVLTLYELFGYRYDPIMERDAIDFERLDMAGYDGIHLTEGGYSSTNRRTTTIGRGFGMWDAESTIWFRWRFKDTERLGELKVPENPSLMKELEVR